MASNNVCISTAWLRSIGESPEYDQEDDEFSMVMLTF